jgi:uncharacterized membrane protein YidH (DUF202 family)
MGLRIRNQRDFAAGLLYIAAGLAFSIGALNYRLGEAARMGPGFFPFWIGVLLVLVGVITAAMAFHRQAVVERVKRPELRPIAWVLGAVVLFGLLLEPLGLVLSLAVLVFVSSMASHEFTWRGTLLNASLLIAFSYATFIWGINLQIDLWPAFLE